MAEFDWVTARFSCSLGSMFKQLELDSKSDVETIKHLVRGRAKDTGGSVTQEFEVNSSNGALFSVTVRDTGGSLPSRSVDFALMSNGISVSGNFRSAPKFMASIKLTDQGFCLLAVDGKEMESWQLRRKALGSLFFPAD